MPEDSGGLVVLLVFALAAGGYEWHRASKLDHQLADVREKVESLSTAGDQIEEDTNQLQQAVERFDDENWRDVVPDVEYIAENSVVAAGDVQAGIADVESAAKEQK
jgi:cell division protein FtsB